eukprot:TRINITY_DN27832_c0_g2_i1.p1 TRINITY_DN27832_c0_g2~~TRINITY_DN27832_c0_g2_i1.p1  ORF type:complete len:533 (-),score=119.26 TRINITY_DN27832_c0_g2_i1:91-1689(-)
MSQFQAATAGGGGGAAAGAGVAQGIAAVAAGSAPAPALDNGYGAAYGVDRTSNGYAGFADNADKNGVSYGAGAYANGMERAEQILRETRQDVADAYGGPVKPANYAFPTAGSFVAEPYSDGQPMYERVYEQEAPTLNGMRQGRAVSGFDQQQQQRPLSVEPPMNYGAPNQYLQQPSYAVERQRSGYGFQQQERSLSPMAARSASPMPGGMRMNGYANGQTNGYSNGYANSYGNGYANGYGNGCGSGCGNAYANGCGNSYANGAHGYGACENGFGGSMGVGDGGFGTSGNLYGGGPSAGAPAFPASGSFIADPYADGAPTMDQFLQMQQYAAPSGPPMRSTASLSPCPGYRGRGESDMYGGNSYAAPLGSYANLGYGGCNGNDGGAAAAQLRGSLLAAPTQQSFLAGRDASAAYGAGAGAAALGGLGAMNFGGLGGPTAGAGLGPLGGLDTKAFPPDLASFAAAAAATSAATPGAANALRAEAARADAARPRTPTPRSEGPPKTPPPRPPPRARSREPAQPRTKKKQQSRGCC